MSSVTLEAEFTSSKQIAKGGDSGQHEVYSWLNMAPPKGSPCYETLHSQFPGAIPGTAVHARVRTLLEGDRFGFTPENTLFGTSICPDEINNEKGDLADIMKAHWGECFPLGGIGGAPFVGKTGFKAFSHHVPEGGNVLMLFGPHVAVSSSGEVGKYLRLGQSHHSTACGACVGAYSSCLEQSPVSHGDNEFDPNDMQMDWFKLQLKPHVSRIKEHENPMAALAYQSYEAVKTKISNVVNTDFGTGCLVLVGGIQINMPAPYEDHFVPLFFEVRRQGEPVLNLMDEWCLASSTTAVAETDAKASEDTDVSGALAKKGATAHIMQHVVFSWLRWAPQLDSPCYRSLHRFFPGAIPGRAVHARMRIALEDERFCFTPENTLVGTSVCPDEINNEKGDLVDVLKDYWGACFPLGGISATPFVGRAGFRAFSHHVPENGNVCIVFGPHVAISESGEVGKYLREGQSHHSTACGAVIGAYCACTSANGTSEADPEFDEHDMQLWWIKKQILPHVGKLRAHENPMAALAHQSYEMVKQSVLQIVDNDFGSGYLALIGGIQINLPAPCEDHFLPCMFEMRKKGCPSQSLQSVLMP